MAEWQKPKTSALLFCTGTEGRLRLSIHYEHPKPPAAETATGSTNPLDDL